MTVNTLTFFFAWASLTPKSISHSRRNLMFDIWHDIKWSTQLPLLYNIIDRRDVRLRWLFNFLLFPFQDYHVILVHSPPNGDAFVYDLDTTLPFPSMFKEYLLQGVRPNFTLKEEFHRYLHKIFIIEFKSICFWSVSLLLNLWQKLLTSTCPMWPAATTLHLIPNVHI